MTTLQYKLTQVNAAANATTSIAATGNITVHTVTFPKATIGTTSFIAADGTGYLTFPIGSIGSLILDACFPNGLSVVPGAINDFTIITTDTP